MSKNDPVVYRKRRNRQIQHTKSLDSRNRTTHEIDVTTVTHYHLHISEPTIRRIYMIVGLILGIIGHKIYIQYHQFIFLFLRKVPGFLFNLTPFARSILDNSNFRFVFYVGAIFSLLAFIIIFIILYDSIYGFFTSLLISFVFLYAYLYLNFAICHLIIKIPIYFKVLSTLAIILFNIIAFFIIICIIAIFTDIF